MPSVNEFGRIPMVDTRGYPTAAFQNWMKIVLERTGGTSGSSLDLESAAFSNASVHLQASGLANVAVITESRNFDSAAVIDGHNTELETV